MGRGKKEKGMWRGIKGRTGEMNGTWEVKGGNGGQKGLKGFMGQAQSHLA